MAAARVAAIDCGTNSVRLLVADVDPGTGALADVVRRMEIVRLGQGVDATGRIAPGALARTLSMLRCYRAVIDSSGAASVRMVATSATRDAANAAEFIAGVEDVLGIEPEVLSGQEEARLSFAGATAELAGRVPGPYLVADIGGGSTEFVLGGQRPVRGREPLAGTMGGRLPASGPVTAAVSVDIGCVRLTERHLHGDPPSEAEIAAASADIDSALEVASARVPAGRARTLVGLAGSVTTVVALALGLGRYDEALIHHARASADAVGEQAARLLAQTRAQRARLPVMHPGRADVIGGGALILDRIMRRFGFGEVLASEHDILDGIARDLVCGGRRDGERP